MPATNNNCPPNCPGGPECKSAEVHCSGHIPSCKAMSPGSICECELLYLAAVNGELLASSDHVRSLYNQLAHYYLRSSERGCGKAR
jgi:hypothetical protein